jgi:hypothetical protein
MSAAIAFPSPPLAAAGFVLRPYRADDYGAAHASREHPETRRWVNALPQPDSEALGRFLEDMRLQGKLLHHVIAEHGSDAFLGEIVLFQDARGRGDRRG